MTSDNRRTPFPLHRSSTVRVVSCVVLINLFVIALAWFFLYQDRVQEELLAETRTKNLSRILAQNVSDSINKIDLILLTVTDEIEKQLVGKKIEKLPLEPFLSQQRQHLTELNRIVITNYRGDVLFGADGSRKSLADRDYFVHLKNNPDVKLMVAKPVAGVIDGVWIQPVVRRINNPDGSFAGVVLGSIRLEHFLKLFSTIDIGKKGVIVLRDRDLAVIVRHPEPKGIGTVVGQKSVSNEIEKLLASGKTNSTYKATAPIDNIERTLSFNKVSNYPLYIFVGLASGDYLSDWRGTVLVVTLTVLIFNLLLCFASWILISNWNREKQAANALRDSEEHYRVLFNHASEGIILMSLKGKLIEVNESCARMHGYSREEMHGMNLSALDKHIGAQATLDSVRRMMDGEALTFEVEHYHKEGHIFPLEVTASLITYAGESYYLCFHREIAERKRAVEQLKVLSERLQLATSAANLGIWDWNVLDNKLDWDDRMFELYGITKESFPNNFEAWLNGLHPEDKATAIAISQAALNGEQEYDVVFRVLLPDGTLKHIRARALVIMGTDGKAVRMIGINWDISERKRLEEERLELEKQLVFAQKLESLGVLAGGIAHDFNNILAIIMGHCYLAIIDSDNSNNCILEIEKASQRAAELCRQMLAYAGKSHIVQSRFDFGGVVDEMVRMLKSSLPQNAVIKLDSSTDIPFVSGDASQIRQVVMNLIINASEAIGESMGEIRVSLAETAIRADHPTRDHQGKTIKPGLYACLEVTDNGCGMDNETRQRIFEPFYTTKFTGRGLGMSAVLGIIMSHGGALQLFSQKGQGTTFKVYLPVQVSDSAERESIPQRLLAPWQGSGTILLAEDEDQVRLIAATMLNKLGFRVIEASNGKEALELWQKNAADITLVLTDAGMPVMNGYKLFRKLKKLKPDLPIIISSGFGDGDVTSKISREDLAGLIGKPYSFDNFQEVLKSVLDASS